MQDLRTKAGSRKFFLDAATWGHVGELHALIDCLFCPEKLEWMGLDMHPPSKLPGATVPEERILSQDIAANEIWTLTFGMLRARATTQTYYATAYPLILARSLWDDPIKINAFLSQTKTVCEMFKKAESHPNAFVQQLVRRSQMMEPIMRVTSVILLHGNFGQYAVDSLVAYWKQAFEGIAASKPMEDNNRAARSEETRAQESKMMTRVRRSLVPVKSDIGATWDRPVPSSTQASLPTPEKLREDL
ncbi:unnamed protein product [Prorocentrum cordatum]|uniref:Uncharacterized protein n=1 Tax=Prorocentrum cordatum TaxID=2364126 RepID=A0ABN9PUD1_9DINO|nr:unnamed protein product [Polarella glacialis]